MQEASSTLSEVVARDLPVMQWALAIGALVPMEVVLAGTRAGRAIALSQHASIGATVFVVLALLLLLTPVTIVELDRSTGSLCVARYVGPFRRQAVVPLAEAAHVEAHDVTRDLAGKSWLQRMVQSPDGPSHVPRLILRNGGVVHLASRYLSARGAERIVARIRGLIRCPL